MSQYASSRQHNLLSYYSSNKLRPCVAKLEYEGEIRKIEQVSTYKDLLAKIYTKFKDLQPVSKNHLKIVYIDNEDDKVAITVDSDVKEAF